jgi:c-di-GMP-binding flagellar brake protein YcgR
VFYPERGRYEVEFEVVESFFHSTQEALVHLAVSGVRHRKARRASPRVPVSASATATVKYCRTLPRDTALDVRVVDISATGCAFVTQKELSAGDLMVVEFMLTDRNIRMEARVVRIDPAPYGRYRSGCEITEINDGDRKAVSAMAAAAADYGSEEQRNPEAVAALAESRSTSTALSARLGISSDG